MGVITSIRRNVKNAGRCSVFVDDAFFAACPIDVALSLGLRKGLEMSDEIERQLRREDRRIVLRQKAYRFATYKPRTERDISRFLTKAEATDEESADVMQWLREFRLIDDVAYAERFIEASKQRKPLSPSMMRRALLGKGLAESIVESVMQRSVDASDAGVAARAVARKKLRMIASEDARSTEDKLVRFLQYRGYTWDVIKSVVAEWKSGALAVVAMLLVANASSTAQVDTSCGKGRLSETINAFQPTTQPLIGPDGELYFDRKFHPENPDGGSKDADQTWVTRARRGQWEVPQLADLMVYDRSSGKRIRADVIFGFSADNLRALVAGRFVSGSTSMALVLAHRATAEGPFLSYDVVVRDLGKNFYATCSDDASVIIVALDRPSGKGDLDLYRITVDGCGAVSQPVPLADNLNSASFDGAPWLACDQSTLYFASAGREDRKGKSDLYVTRRLDDTWTRWSNPENLGPCINTNEDETAVSLACGSSQLYFTSWDPSTERAGIYTASVAEGLLPQKMVKTVVSVRDAIGDSLVTGLRIARVGSASGSCAEAMGWPVDARTRTATLMLPANTTTELSIAKNPAWHLIDAGAPNQSSAEVTMTVVAKDKPLCSITFDKSDTTLSPAGHAALEALRTALGTGSLSRLRVIGWTDASGSSETNARISLARARVVAEQATILVPGGELRHIGFEGKGVESIQGRPVANDAPQSRRVDVFVDP